MGSARAVALTPVQLMRGLLFHFPRVLAAPIVIATRLVHVHAHLSAMPSESGVAGSGFVPAERPLPGTRALPSMRMRGRMVKPILLSFTVSSVRFLLDHFMTAEPVPWWPAYSMSSLRMLCFQ